MAADLSYDMMAFDFKNEGGRVEQSTIQERDICSGLFRSMVNDKWCFSHNRRSREEM
jgi:hypothetical protein